jgi:Mg2+-importing ATPase
VVLERHCDVMQKENDAVLLDAFLISHFQTGLKNVLDRAVLAISDTQDKLITGYRKVDEIPFDFVRRMMSVLVEKPDKDHQLLTKGAPEAVFPCCGFTSWTARFSRWSRARAAELIKHYEDISADGFRVLAVAHKQLQTPLTHFQGGRMRLDPQGLHRLP